MLKTFSPRPDHLSRFCRPVMPRWKRVARHQLLSRCAQSGGERLAVGFFPFSLSLFIWRLGRSRTQRIPLSSKGRMEERRASRSCELGRRYTGALGQAQITAPLDCESLDASVECHAYVCEHEDQRDPETKTSHQIPLWVGAV